MSVQTTTPEEAFSRVPEPGQLVRARGRSWVVAEVDRSELDRPQHLVTLTSVEDDAYDETVQLLWEVEPGTRVMERATLPTPHLDRFDDPDRLAAFLDAVRWGAVTSADSTALQSPFRSGIAIEDYQLDPVVHAIRMPRVNLLIADDVGLGKTIEAGLVAQELLLRHRARTILVVCPASLCVKWRDEMAEKFGLEFRIVDSELLRHLRRTRGLRANPWTHYPRLIVSMDWLKRDRPMRLLREVLPPAATYPRKFDLLIVDEVHNAAPSGRGKYATDSQRTTAIRAIAPHFEHRLFLSATPHNGYRESWMALLEMLDSQRFARGVDADPRQLERIMVRRLKSELPPNEDGTPRFPRRVIDAIEVRYSAAERAAHRRLGHSMVRLICQTYKELTMSTVPASPTDPVVLTVGDITVTRHWVVTPNGNAPLAGSHWQAMDLSRTERKLPGWAIVCAIIFFLACLLGLLFLAVKQDHTTGYVEVTVESGSLRHVSQVPVTSVGQVAQIRQVVYQAQSLATEAGR